MVYKYYHHFTDRATEDFILPRGGDKVGIRTQISLTPKLVALIII